MSNFKIDKMPVKVEQHFIFTNQVIVVGYTHTDK